MDRRESSYKPFKHDWRQMKYRDNEYDSWKDKLLAKTEGDWVKAAYDAVDRISARFQPAYPPVKKMHDVFCDCSLCQPEHNKYIKGIS